MATRKLQYGLKENKLLHIDTVEKGEQCGCVCPHCKQPLSAKKGGQRTHHFAHVSKQPCKHAYETTLHLLAKEIIAQHKTLVLPEVAITFESNRPPLVLFPEMNVSVDSVVLEQKDGDIVPDVLVESKGHRLLVEIYVTHRVDEDKQQYLASHNLSCIEVDLSNAPRDLDYDTLADIVINQTDNKTWLHNGKAHSVHTRLLNNATVKHVNWSANKRAYGSERKHLVSDCPIRIRNRERDTRADAMWECLYCDNCVSFQGGEVLCHEMAVLKPDAQMIVRINRICPN